MRTRPMVPLSQTVSRQRSERRIAVRLPLKVRGRDAHGFAFEEDTASENLCRNGAAFVTRFDVAIGSDAAVLERTIDVHIKTLRKKLGDLDYIETVRGVGYRFRENEP